MLQQFQKVFIGQTRLFENGTKRAPGHVFGVHGNGRDDVPAGMPEKNVATALALLNESRAF